jgi:hypothetical protein
MVSNARTQRSDPMRAGLAPLSQNLRKRALETPDALFIRIKVEAKENGRENTRDKTDQTKEKIGLAVIH